MIFFMIFCLFSALIFFSLRFSWWRKNLPYNCPRILMYHMVCEHLPKNISKFNRLRVKPRQFEKHLQWLQKNDFKSYTMSELVKLESIPEKTVVITFDDGYKDNFTNAFPLLKQYNFKATIYIVLNRFQQNWATDKDLNQASEELNSENMLSNNQIKEMLNSNLIEIGSHTLDHVNLAKISEDEKLRQIKESKEQIEKTFNISCNSFAYPFGFFDNESVKMVEVCSYTNAVTTINGVFNKSKNSNLKIPRILISGRQGIFAFILKIKKGRSR